MRPKNYASLINVSDSPLLVINFENFLEKNITIHSEWVDPEGKKSRV
jgi:hypothetical protein